MASTNVPPYRCLGDERCIPIPFLENGRLSIPPQRRIYAFLRYSPPRHASAFSPCFHKGAAQARESPKSNESWPFRLLKISEICLYRIVPARQRPQLLTVVRVQKKADIEKEVTVFGNTHIIPEGMTISVTCSEKSPALQEFFPKCGRQEADVVRTTSAISRMGARTSLLPSNSLQNRYSSKGMSVLRVVSKRRSSSASSASRKTSLTSKWNGEEIPSPR